MDRAPGNTGITWRELAEAVWLAAVQASGQAQDASASGRPERPDELPQEQGIEETPYRAARPQPEQSYGGGPGLAEAYLRAQLSGGTEAWPVAGAGQSDSTAPDPPARQLRPPLRRAGSALPGGSAAMSRALRPFKRPVPSLTDVEMDEERTAEQAAEDNLWLPYMRPASSRQLELTLVVDEGPSMPAWRRTVTQFTALLGQLGAFRDVRLRYLDLVPAEEGNRASARVILRGPKPGSGVSDPAELLGQTGRRIVLVLTDGLGPAWLDGAAQRVLAAWAQAAPVAVIHLLPQRTWHHTAARPWRVRLRSPESGAPNRRYMVDIGASRRDVLDQLPEDWAVSVPIPVLELEKDWLSWWARLVTGQGGDWQDAWVLLAGSSSPSLGKPAGLASTGREQVLRFRANASPTAVRLAMHLAATPLEPALIDVVQRTLIPESRAVHLAEIWASGLIRTVPESRVGSPAPRSQLEFIDGAREALLAGAVRAETALAFATAADHYGNRTLATQAMRGALLDPDKSPDPPVNHESLHFVRVELAVLKALSGPYLNRARRLGDKLARLDLVTNPETAAPNETGIQMRDDVLTGQGSSEVPAGDGNGPVLDATGRGSLPPSPTPATGLPALQGFSPPVWNVPPRNVNFTGREDLLGLLHQRLREAETAAVTPNTLHGMGGVGKSQLAIEYVYRHVDDYDIIWWVPAEQQSQILASLAELAQSLGLDVGTEANTAVPAVREALRSGKPYKNWLLVFDNAEEIATVRSYFPTGGSGKIVVTSRNLDWSSVADTLSVDVFQREESKSLLQRRNPDLSDNEADHLAEALGDLPLAIEQAASWRAVTGMAVDEYLSLIEQKRLELFDETTSPDYSTSVAAAWNVSLDRLERGNKAALQLLQVCAFLAPEPIPRILFRGSRSVRLTPELDEVVSDPIKLGRAIRDLSRYALARIDHRNNTIQLHRLVQAALIRRMPAELHDEMRHYAHILLANANPNNPGASDQWPRYQALLPHVLASDVIACDDPWVRQLLAGMVRFLYAWGDHESSLALSRDITNAWLERFGEEDTETLALRKYYAFVMRVMGQYSEAADVDNHTVAVYQRIADEDDEGFLDSLLQLGANMRARGAYTAARDNDEIVLSRARRAFGEDDPATLAAAHNLGVSLRLSGDFKRALELDQDTYQRRVIVLGEDASNTMLTLTGMAIDQCEVGDYLAARTLQEDTYARAARLFRASNPTAIFAARNLAVFRRRAGDLDGARELSEDTVTRYQRRYGDSYPDTLAAVANLAVDLRQAGDFDTARTLDEQTSKRFRQLLGERHSHTLIVEANLAVTLRLLGEVDAAYRLNVVTLAGMTESLGESHPVTLACAANHGSDYYALQNFEEALRQDERTVELLRQHWGDEHPVALAVALNLALDYRAVGRMAEGDALRTDMLARLRRVLGDSHPATVAASKGFRADVDSAPMPL